MVALLVIYVLDRLDFLGVTIRAESCKSEALETFTSLIIGKALFVCIALFGMVYWGNKHAIFVET